MNHKSRIEEYKKLREEIENIDVYSFDDPKKYPIKKNENIVEIHDLDEKDEYPEEKKIEKDHIKKKHAVSFNRWTHPSSWSLYRNFTKRRDRKKIKRK